MNHASSSDNDTSDTRKPVGPDDIDNGEHKGAKTVDNPGPGTPGKAEGAIDGEIPRYSTRRSTGIRRGLGRF